MTKTKKNDAANQLWEQIFATLATTEGATLCESDYDNSDDESRIRKALALAGWSEQEIQSRVDLHRAQEAAAPVTSPGVAPHAEFIFDRLCNDIEAAMVRLKLDSPGRVARGIEPRVGPLVGLTNVIMTDESIVIVGSFLFRFCGLVARAFTRTLLLAPTFWESANYSDESAQFYLKTAPEVMGYWLRIYISFCVTGTPFLVPFRPANRNELVFEQVARAMEIFAIAHEYSHHHLDHGRRIGADPKLEEFCADQLALKIAYEVERRPLVFVNPYLSSGAGAVILLKALQTLREVTEVITGVQTKQTDTHPDVASRIAKFDCVAVLKPKEFENLNSFRKVSARIMEKTGTEVSKLLQAMPTDVRNQLRTLSQAI